MTRLSKHWPVAQHDYGRESVIKSCQTGWQHQNARGARGKGDIDRSVQRGAAGGGEEVCGRKSKQGQVKIREVARGGSRWVAARGGKALAQPLLALSRGDADWHGNAWLGSRGPPVAWLTAGTQSCDRLWHFYSGSSLAPPQLASVLLVTVAGAAGRSYAYAPVVLGPTFVL